MGAGGKMAARAVCQSEAADVRLGLEAPGIAGLCCGESDAARAGSDSGEDGSVSHDRHAIPVVYKSISRLPSRVLVSCYAGGPSGAAIARGARLGHPRVWRICGSDSGASGGARRLPSERSEAALRRHIGASPANRWHLDAAVSCCTRPGASSGAMCAGGETKSPPKRSCRRRVRM